MIAFLSWEQLSLSSTRAALCALPLCGFLFGAVFPFRLLSSAWSACILSSVAVALLCSAGLNYFIGLSWADALANPLALAAACLGASWGLVCHVARFAKTKPTTIFLSIESTDWPQVDVPSVALASAISALQSMGKTPESSSLADTLIVRAKESPELWLSIDHDLPQPSLAEADEEAPDEAQVADLVGAVTVSFVWQPTFSLQRIFSPLPMADLSAIRAAVAREVLAALPEALLSEFE